MIRAFFVELVFPLLLVLLIRSLLRNFLASSRSSSARRPRPAAQSSAVASGGELKKDPVCGTYVSPAAGLSQTVNGTVVCFCSRECKEKYLAG
jgi:YHS domain-containing protein